MLNSTDILFRFATQADAKALFRLNALFNGDDATTLERVSAALENDRQEIIVVAEYRGVIAGFACAQVMKSFCYDEAYAEITELFVEEPYRNKTIARGLLSFLEAHCEKHFGIHNFQLITARSNTAARALYDAVGYVTKEEIFYRKRKN